MRACLDGAEIPPWDVVESLLQDLVGERGAAFAARESVRAAALYSASAAAHDRRPGGRQALVERLELMLREQAYAAQRVRAAGVDNGARPPDPDTLAWAQDDHTRASARCTELRKRLSAVTVPQGWFRAEEEPPAEPATPRAPGPRTAPGPAAGSERAPAARKSPAAGPSSSAPGRPQPPAPKRKKPRGARFAGLEVDDDTGAPLAVPVLPVPPTDAAVPRGARFGGAPTAAEADARGRDAARPAADPVAQRAATEAVDRLVRLRTEGRSGEAHGVLCEAAGFGLRTGCPCSPWSCTGRVWRPTGRPCCGRCPRCRPSSWPPRPVRWPRRAAPTTADSCCAKAWRGPRRRSPTRCWLWTGLVSNRRRRR